MDLGRPVPEEGAYAGFFQAVDGPVRVPGRGVVMAPVEEGRRAAVDLVEGAEEVGEIQIVGREAGGEVLVHAAPVVAEGPVARDAPEARLPSSARPSSTRRASGP